MVLVAFPGNFTLVNTAAAEGEEDPDAPENIKFLDENGKTVSWADIIEKAESGESIVYGTIDADNKPTIWGEAGKTTYLVVGYQDKEDVSYGNGTLVTVNGIVYLILRDFPEDLEHGLSIPAGIYVPTESSLTILGGTKDGTNDDGCTLVVGGKAAEKQAGIGGNGTSYSSGIIEIYGGKIQATGGKSAAGIGGGFGESTRKVIIGGGTVVATGGKSAAGIGGGSGGSAGDVTICGGSVEATGGKKTDNNILGGAGIGGGNNVSDDIVSGGVVRIEGGSIKAEGADGGAGIGGGNGRDGGNIEISGGTITNSKGASGGAGIGGGNGASGGIISISGGTIGVLDRENVTNSTGADGSSGGAGIGGGKGCTGGTIVISDNH